MKLVYINKEQLNSFSKKQKYSQFLQSCQWGDFQEEIGASVLRLGLKDEEKIIFAFLVIEKKLFGAKNYFYIPRVDFSALDDSKQKKLFVELKKIAKERRAVFIRIEPLSKLRIKNYELRIRPSIDIQAKKTSIVDIARSEDEIIKSFHQKTRYNIRLAEKRGVFVRVGTEKDFEKFWQIMKETSQRDDFRLHAKDYYKKQLEIDFIELLVAEYEGEVIAGNIVSFFGNMASYIHGSSSNKHRNIMAPFALQWEAIKNAKAKNCLHYDLNGIDEEKWPGVTRFKRGFRGEEVEYPGCYDVVFDIPFYYFYKVLRQGRRFIGRLIGK